MTDPDKKDDHTSAFDKDRFGINMKKWCREEEQYIIRKLDEGVDPAKLLEWHCMKLQWLQHERLVHFIVTCLTSIAVLSALSFMIFRPDTLIVSGPVFLGLIILLFFYMLHYFFLENTVQHWYRIAEELHDRSMK